jgi:hypothetical protein
MIMSIIDISNGKTALDHELNDIHHGEDHDHKCASLMVGRVRQMHEFAKR